MAVQHSTVALNSAAKPLVGGPSGPGSSDVTSVFSTLVLVAAVDLLIGGPSLTRSSYGLKVPAGSTLTLDLKPGDVPYAVTASGAGNTSQPVLRLGAAA